MFGRLLGGNVNYRLELDLPVLLVSNTYVELLSNFYLLLYSVQLL